MASILKVDKIRGTGLDSDSISIDVSGNITTTKTPLGFVPSGGILQTVEATDSTQTTTTSGSYVDTGLTATITPSSTSSKILAIAKLNIYGGGGGYMIAATMIRTIGGTSTNLAENDGAGMIQHNCPDISGNYPFGADHSAMILDSPSTTRAVTYKMQFKNNTGSATSYSSVNSVTDCLVLMEIAQ